MCNLGLQKVVLGGVEFGWLTRRTLRALPKYLDQFTSLTSLAILFAFGGDNLPPLQASVCLSVLDRIGKNLTRLYFCCMADVEFGQSVLSRIDTNKSKFLSCSLFRMYTFSSSIGPSPTSNISI